MLGNPSRLMLLRVCTYLSVCIMKDLFTGGQRERKKGQCGFLVRLAAVLVGVTDGVSRVRLEWVGLRWEEGGAGYKKGS